MQGLLDELEQIRQYGPLLDVDATVSLQHASNKLSVLTDTAGALITAAQLLPDLSDTVMRFCDAVNKLGSMEGNWG